MDLCSLAIAATALAGAAAASELVTRYGPDLVPYATVARPDGTYRRMLTAPETLAAAISGAPLPDGARILMETYRQPGVVGTVFHKRKTAGQWQYGFFPGDAPDLSTAPRASCLSCHISAADTHLTFTRPTLDRVARGAAPERFSCDRRGRQPCGEDVYRDGGQ